MSIEEKSKNNLMNEKSPYLLQHADNPVHWYPWSEEAFEKAVQEDKPIFLSIGYSTCHWCHVMEHESFENQEIANYLNEHFISIKVDREERPDVDNIYMSAVQAMTGSGGWPLSIFMTPDKKPFFGGTYFPPVSRWGSPGFADVLQSVNNAWQSNRTKIVESSNHLTQLLSERVLQKGEDLPLSKEIFKKSFDEFNRSYDSSYGGFGSSPKFPTTHNLSLLLRYYKRSKDPQALSMVEHTLKQMADGGMYDQLGGGFHRYSTDQYWQVPHFEKMLYDQAIIAQTYLEAYQITHNEFYADIALEIYDYVLRDMQFSEGGFYSAEDADSLDPDHYGTMSVDPKQPHEKKEGAFYVWAYDEIMSLLGEPKAKMFNYYYGIESKGNARQDPHGEFIGKNIIFVDKSLNEAAQHFNIDESEMAEALEQSKSLLFQARSKRPRPHLDDKILVDWNGLMISSLAKAGAVLGEEKYSDAAEKSAQFILENLIDAQGRLLHRYRDNEAGITGTIEDYAFFIGGLLDLYEVTFHIEYLQQAERLAQDMIKHFWDEVNGGFYFTADDSEELIIRSKELYDGAIPSGNSVAALDLIKLAHITLNRQWSEKAEGLFQGFSSEVAQRPSAYSQFLIAFDFAAGPSQEIVIAQAQSNQPQAAGFLKEIHSRFLPNKVLILRPSNEKNLQKIIKLSPFVKNQMPQNEKTTVYVCENHNCKLPVNDLKNLQNILNEYQ